MNENKLKKIRTIMFFSVFFLVFIILIFTRSVRNEKLYKYGKYTICKTLGVHSLENGREINYKYIVDGKKYDKWSGLTVNNVIKTNGKYFIIFLPTNPKECKILLDKPVSNKMLKAPSKGWSKTEFDELIKKVEN